MRDHTFTHITRALVALAVCIVAATGIWLVEGLESASLRNVGMVDWSGHLLTALIVAIGVRMVRLPIPIWSILVGGIVLDLGHLFTMLNLIGEVPGSSRNGSHSLIVVVIIALVGLVDRRHANIWLGIALGALSHLWRDMGTGTVPLLWPVLNAVFSTSFWRYLAVTVGAGIALTGSGMLLDIFSQANRDQGSR